MQTKQDLVVSVSPLLNALLDVYSKKKETTTPSEQSILKVSRTVSLFAFWYEKMRNAVEYREDHLVRRAAIERILKRRFMLNPEGKNVAENLIRELLWARYLQGYVTEDKIPQAQKIIDKYLLLRREIVPGRPGKELKNLDQFVMDLLSCELEELLAPNPQREAINNFVYQSLLPQIDITDKKLNEDKNIYLYTAMQMGFAKSDISQIRYRLTKILLPELTNHTASTPHAALPYFIQVYEHIENSRTNPVVEKLRRFVKRNSPPYLIIRDLIETYPKDAGSIFSSEEQLQYKVDEICRRRYQETKAKLSRAGIRSIIYIFLTKMVLAILIEYPVDKYFQKSVEFIPLAINIIFPPFLMFLLVMLTGVPGADNTKRIFERIHSLIRPNVSFNKTLIKVKASVKRPLLTFGFSFIYLLAFILTFGTILFTLSLIKFNIVSQGIFIFFVSMVLFFGYRIKQTAKEYLLIEKEGLLTPVSDFFMLPILSLGKWLSSEIGKLNIFIFIFDFIIEAPFKAIFEIGEEWINFMKSKKEEFT